MDPKNFLLQKLSQYGINACELSEKQLQEKIIQLYDLLQQTTTQNLLLKKQNDDIILQINTIEEVFADATNNLKSGLSPRTYQKVNSQTFFDSRQEKKHILQPHKNILKTKSTINLLYHNLNINKTKTTNNRFSQQFNNSEYKSVQTEEKTPRYASKPHRNSRFYSDPKLLDKQQTSRIVARNKDENQKEKALNQKIQILMKQNEIILKRMSQIQTKFINKSQKDQENFPYHKNFDDQSTHLSTHATSIKNICAKKDYQTYLRSLSPNNRTHYSTSNLRSYCPSVE